MYVCNLLWANKCLDNEDNLFDSTSELTASGRRGKNINCGVLSRVHLLCPSRCCAKFATETK